MPDHFHDLPSTTAGIGYVDPVDDLAMLMARADQMPAAQQDELWRLNEMVRRDDPRSAEACRRLGAFAACYPVTTAMVEPYRRNVMAHHSMAYDAALIEVIPPELLHQARSDEEWGPFLISYHHKHAFRDQARHIKRLAAQGARALAQEGKAMTVLHPDPDSGFIVIDPPPADGLVLASGLMRLACRAVADAAVWVRLLVDHLDGAKQALQGRH